jgi:hypothetical protein
MKTLMLWDQVEDALQYTILAGNYSHLHNVYLNSCEDEKKEEELNNLIFDAKGKYKIEFINLEKPTKFPEHDIVIVCGFLP